MYHLINNMEKIVELLGNDDSLLTFDQPKIPKEKHILTCTRNLSLTIL